MKLILVRHAHAGSPLAGDADRSRELTPEGIETADALASSLLPYLPSRIISSPYKRAIQTVTSLAERLGIEVDLDERLSQEATDSQVVELAAFLAAVPDQMAIVLAGHGPTLARLAETLLGSQGVSVHHGALDLHKGGFLAFDLDTNQFPRVITSLVRADPPNWEANRLLG
jgi:phosphohistidine phosphatase SixA